MKSHFLLCVLALCITGSIRWLSYSYSDYAGELFLWVSIPFIAAAVYCLAYPIKHGAIRVLAILLSSAALCFIDLRIQYYLRVEYFKYIQEITFLEVGAVYWILNFPAVILLVVLLEVRRSRSKEPLNSEQVAKRT